MIISQKSSCYVDDQNSISGRPQLFSGRHRHEDTPIFLAWYHFEFCIYDKRQLLTRSLVGRLPATRAPPAGKKQSYS